jgi:hypothetical protein
LRSESKLSRRAPQAGCPTRSRDASGMERIIERFRARAADGRVVDIVKYVDLTNAGPKFGGADDDPIEGLPRFRTTDGCHVNHVAGNEYEVLNAPEPFIVWRI